MSAGAAICCVCPPLILAVSTAGFVMDRFHRPICLLLTTHGFPSSAPLQLSVLLLLTLPVIVAVSWKGQDLDDAAVRGWQTPAFAAG
ncbi:hypothetical protein I1E95_03020 [Synechococcus sp. CBW1107]|uniref:hypothetical protein n=1 Tax=Synechococcus sp. CBW1107 TaxID=2789857 RepID=UPI0018CF31A7|nr:hypothetical protein [Synechococcus sp. CBW1107]QPN57144.1 hypothetical protein I1E95_03020 [Synechococcus sp. CBW1107]